MFLINSVVSIFKSLPITSLKKILQKLFFAEISVDPEVTLLISFKLHLYKVIEDVLKDN